MPARSKGEAIVVGVDLGGTTFTGGVLNRAGEVLAQASYDTPRSDQEPLVLGAIAAAVQGLLQQAAVPPDRLAGLGVGIPGPVDPEAGVIKQCPNLHELDGVAAADILTEQVGAPAFIGNDAFCATLAELRYGAGRDVDNLVMLTLGTGIGGGIALDNKVHRGPRQSMGEVGHLILDPDGPICGCGNHGCFEAIAGRDGIVDRAIRLLETGHPSILGEKVGSDHDELTPRLIAEAAGEGDGLACQVMAETGYYIGLALCNCIVLCDPDLIVIGGGIAAAGDLLFEPIRRTVRHRSHISGFDVSKIIPAELGNDAGMYGAAALAWERLEERGSA
jgi:glucokinase